MRAFNPRTRPYRRCTCTTAPACSGGSALHFTRSNWPKPKRLLTKRKAHSLRGHSPHPRQEEAPSTRCSAKEARATRNTQHTATARLRARASALCGFTDLTPPSHAPHYCHLQHIRREKCTCRRLSLQVSHPAVFPFKGPHTTDVTGGWPTGRPAGLPLPLGALLLFLPANGHDPLSVVTGSRNFGQPS